MKYQHVCGSKIHSVTHEGNKGRTENTDFDPKKWFKEG